MDMQQVHDYAKKLVDVHGDTAEVEAASKLQQAHKSGDEQQIENWRRIRAAVRERKASHVS